ncbi:hypothetical protein BO70DRAFT_181218 [Aspergillus heteromorphus CBS 117.55]|uniref:Uncharacterized protein n=1 Tax=Aspergillus heteromorphus CBS 117.55 TaxID=1448321 RepID=A0A317WU86_9EURO|nr:uncharacterized protein BO70DRAFT_181218 [Aspergillus heteromorphus CBS 117.55]PWY88428.1 hypothetical protein BO70DRAFT_181218 [Aspergillus heteromorphus CBS 117.55]
MMEASKQASKHGWCTVAFAAAAPRPISAPRPSRLSTTSHYGVLRESLMFRTSLTFIWRFGSFLRHRESWLLRAHALSQGCLLPAFSCLLSAVRSLPGTCRRSYDLILAHREATHIMIHCGRPQRCLISVCLSVLDNALWS